MADWDLLLTDANIATMVGGDYGIDREISAIAIAGDRIAWLGSDQPPGTATTVRSLDNRWITPALIDCHTHLVFAGDRAAEFEQRLQGRQLRDHRQRRRRHTDNGQGNP